MGRKKQRHYLLTNAQITILEEIALAHELVGRRGRLVGKPSVSRLLESIADGELCVIAESEPRLEDA